jgi:uncharacterized protein (UPF0335 family)
MPEQVERKDVQLEPRISTELQEQIDRIRRREEDKSTAHKSVKERVTG